MVPAKELFGIVARFGGIAVKFLRSEFDKAPVWRQPSFGDPAFDERAEVVDRIPHFIFPRSVRSRRPRHGRPWNIIESRSAHSRRSWLDRACNCERADHAAFYIITFGSKVGMSTLLWLRSAFNV